MKFNGHLQRVADEAKRDIKTRFSFSWKGITTAGAIICFLGFFWRGAIFYAQTTADSTKIKQLESDVKVLKIEKNVNDSTNIKYIQEILRLINPEKGEAIIEKLEKERKAEIAKWKKDLKVKDADT